MVGAATGGAVVALVLFATVGAAPAAAPGAGPSPGAGAAPPLGPGLAALGGIAAGALVAWTVGKPVGGAFRRAALAMMAVMGTALVAVLTVPAHELAGRAGLAAVAALCLAAVVAARRVFLSGGSDDGGAG